MKKQLIGVMLAVLLLVSLTACGKRSEAQIKSDFIDQDAYITPYNMTVDLFEITGRETTGNSDIITVSVVVSDDQYSMSRECVMDYEKYNDGWRLDRVTTNYADYLADNASVSQADADQLVAEQIDGNVSFTKREDSNNHVRFYYTFTDAGITGKTATFSPPVAEGFSADGVRCVIVNGSYSSPAGINGRSKGSDHLKRRTWLAVYISSTV